MDRIKPMKDFDRNFMQILRTVNLRRISTVISRKSYEIVNLRRILTVISRKSYEIVIIRKFPVVISRKSYEIVNLRKFLAKILRKHKFTEDFEGFRNITP